MFLSVCGVREEIYMLKVLLVDDEYFIVQGLLVLIDWKAEGYEVAATAANGREALDYLKENKVDLVITDIAMPIMSGLELLETVRREHISEAAFVILSGYSDFSYAQQAIRDGCMDYLLKPVEREELQRILRKFNNLSEHARQEQQDQERYEEAYLARNVISLLFGKHDDFNLDYVKKHMQLSEGVRYIEIEFCDAQYVEAEEGELRALQRKLYQSCRSLLREDSTHCVFDVSQDRVSYGVGFIYCDYMAARLDCTEREYLDEFHRKLEVLMQQEIRLLVGKKVADIHQVSVSYGTACILRPLEAFHSRKPVYIYEDEAQVKQGGIVLCKESLDALFSAIEQNEQDEIQKGVDRLFLEMQQNGMESDSVNLNINYLLFRLVHLASELDSDADQEEILRFISSGAFGDGVGRGSKLHLTRFACAYADYLMQLRKNVSSGILAEIEKDIRRNYAENLTLRDLGKKYYINSSYLGQIFRKKYGQSFKDYLTGYRINEAAKQLRNTDKRISEIAENVGYRDGDYFIRKFIELKGCTPSRYRKDA